MKWIPRICHALAMILFLSLSSFEGQPHFIIRSVICALLGGLIPFIWTSENGRL